MERIFKAVKKSCSLLLLVRGMLEEYRKNLYIIPLLLRVQIQPPHPEEYSQEWTMMTPASKKSLSTISLLSASKFYSQLD